MKIKEGWTIGAGLVLLITGIALTFSWNRILDAAMNKDLVLLKTSRRYEQWLAMKEIQLTFYFWNWTNSDDLESPGFKPVFVEVGPYTYKETSEPTSLVWNANGTLTYQKRRLWFFDSKKSNGSEDDVIISLNAIATTAAYGTRFEMKVKRMALNAALQFTEKLYVKKTVRELLFAGYSNPLIDLHRAFSTSNVPFDRFGWFYQRNGTTTFEGIYNIETGTNGMDTLGKTRRWNYKQHTGFYKDKCGVVKGSGGELFPPKRTKQDVLQVFAPDFCRYMELSFTKEEIVKGIPAYRYETNESLFDTGKLDSENSCFCEGQCPPPGALNSSTCRHGAPGFVSNPHFYLADPSYRDNVIGMQPNHDRHNTYITLEPTHGIPLDVAVRFQINIYLQPFKDLKMFSKIKPFYFPILWFERTATIPDDKLSEVKFLLSLDTIGMAAGVTLLIIGMTLICIVIALRTYKNKKLQDFLREKKGVDEPMLKGNDREKKIEKLPTPDGSPRPRNNLL